MVELLWRERGRGFALLQFGAGAGMPPLIRPYQPRAAPAQSPGVADA